MRYISTRGGIEPVGFDDAVMMGLARDEGLLLPEGIPDVRPYLPAWRGLSYPDLATAVMRRFVDWPDAALDALVRDSYATFRHAEVTPVVSHGTLHVLELFHGPTLAFKDVALQFLGRCFERILAARGATLNILAATSGDTGSAAIAGVRGRKGIRIFVMHPHGRVSPIQARQMTTVADENVFNLAVDGSFDDCQRIMKALFADLAFKDRLALGSVNSINWARLLAQVVYYFYGAFRVMERTGAETVRFAVPTGNFGDVFAGYLAARMGLPVEQLVLATNENAILARFFTEGLYRVGEVRRSLSPSMDIQVASNFERYLYYRLGASPAELRDAMDTFRRNGALTVPPLPDGRMDDLIVAGSADTTATLETIRKVYEQHGYLLDPHTAVGVSVAERFSRDAGAPMLCLATAHPAKFPEAMRRALGADLARHPAIQALEGLPAKVERVAADEERVRAYLVTHAGSCHA